MSSIDVPAWGLKRNITPQLGARLVQQGNRLHYLADRVTATTAGLQRKWKPP
ncbi:Putative antitoxin YfjZ [Serratia quinivorans]|jgi:cytoskeleton bundling-enhancing protein CbeA-like protein|nr:Putative antitoxin YfjZ [Serratia proteamaculans]CAI1094359.1 Putative antitoxin YfjZ [Serratia proteamaculans]CAI1129441.1 Putative antitoxin YfjZ [Serratia proteamaculans]CAI1662893.1 Putative antitoxin YfjZ [Serratia proteamaculans]SPZ57071.1 Putative antitoxin YfjZ [Serratia quinivorans]